MPNLFLQGSDGDRVKKFHFNVILPIFDQIQESKIFCNANLYAESEILNIFLCKNIFLSKNNFKIRIQRKNLHYKIF